MNTRGEKHVIWETIYGAIVELINLYPGSVDTGGLPWYSVSITFPKEAFEGECRDIRIFGLSGIAMGDVSVYDLGHVIRVSWDYNHLWNTPISYKLWRMHATQYLESLIKVLATNKIKYKVRCQMCGEKMDVVESVDTNDIPGDHYWSVLHERCKDIVKRELLQ